jgi:hypothetical protein
LARLPECGSQFRWYLSSARRAFHDGGGSLIDAHSSSEKRPTTPEIFFINYSELLSDCGYRFFSVAVIPFFLTPKIGDEEE